MENLKFVQLQKENKDHYKLLESLMIPYHMELNSHKPDSMVNEELLKKLTSCLLDRQGDPDRHLELCYSDNNLIGFLYGKVDHEDHKGHKKPGFGYIMELYVKPEYRRQGHGKAMFSRLEKLFFADGVTCMYLNTGTETGIAFWTSLGFKATDEIQPHNDMVIYEKAMQIREVITISVNEYLSHELVRKITEMQRHSVLPEWTNRIRKSIYDDKYDSDCFHVIALNENDDVIGRLYCIQNQDNPKRWYYGNLAVIPAYRRMKIATRMINAAIQKISDMGSEILCCYVEPDNKASICLQKSLGFIEKTTVPFNLLTVDGQIMFEMNTIKQYNVIPATGEEARFVMMFYTQNREALHGKYISLAEWKEILSHDDSDEKNFLVCNGAIPVAWLRINGLENKDTAWISMLAVSDKHQRQGIGSFAVLFAEDFVKAKGFTALGIHTNADNIAAQNCYKKLRYTITEENECTNGDGEKRRGLTFYRDHLDAVRMSIDDI